MHRTVMGLACAAVVTLAGAAAPLSAQDVLWDTGQPNPVIFNGNPSNLGFTSGNLAGQNQRWSAAPFRIETDGAIITQIDLDYFIAAGSEPSDVRYIIWERTGLARPVNGDQFSQGLLGAAGPGSDDPRVEGEDNWFHAYGGLNIPIPAGDYYLTVYGSGWAPGNTSDPENPLSSIAWFTGAAGQAEDLEQDFMWRSANFPVPGFEVYNPAVIMPVAGQDPQDIWNVSFAIRGIPAPSAAPLLALGMAFAGRRRR